MPELLTYTHMYITRVRRCFYFFIKRLIAQTVYTVRTKTNYKIFPVTSLKMLLSRIMMYRSSTKIPTAIG
jgi:hypothetical protein